MKYYNNLTDACAEALYISRGYKKMHIAVMQQINSKLYYVAQYADQVAVADTVICEYLDTELVNSTSPNQNSNMLNNEPETTGDMQLPEISMPVNKNELMLIGLSLREYRYALSKNHKDVPRASYTLLMQQLTALEAKVISNEISWDSLHGSNPNNV